MASEISEKLDDDCFAEFVELIHKLTGITIGDNRHSMLVSRLRKRLRANDLTDFRTYLEFVRNDADEREQFVNNMTTNKTYFHRTPRVWKYLIDEFVPNWLQAGHNRSLNVWSAAASTGEEAYTAGVLLEDVRSRHPSFTYQITGTDISSRVIKEAQEGVYATRAVELFRQAEPVLFQKYMKGSDAAGYRVAPSIASRITFKTHNLFRPFQHRGQFDVVLLRNVLIYFTKPDQEKVLANIDRSLQPDGALIIGESETLSPLKTNFTGVSPLIYQTEKAVSGKAA